MTDPRAALAEALPSQAAWQTDNSRRSVAAYQADRLAERGVRLVTEPILRAALHEWFCGNVNHPVSHTTTGCVRGAAAMMLWLEGHPAIAALSADKP